jgi:hypothetical protein
LLLCSILVYIAAIILLLSLMHGISIVVRTHVMNRLRKRT